MSHPSKRRDRAKSVAIFRDQYAELMRSAFLIDLQYRASIAIWIIWGITEPIISLGIWWSIAATGAVEGYTREAFARYFFGVALVNQATLSWDAWNIDRWIREGEMNYRLTRPIAPIHEAIADNIAYKAPTAMIILTAGSWRPRSGRRCAFRSSPDDGHSRSSRSCSPRPFAFSTATPRGCSPSGRRVRPRSSSCSSASRSFSRGASRRCRCCHRRW